MILNNMFIDFGLQNGAQKLGGSHLFASLKGCLEPSWPQVVTCSDFQSILGSLGCLLGLSWDGFGTILAPLCIPWGAPGVYFGCVPHFRTALGRRTCLVNASWNASFGTPAVYFGSSRLCVAIVDEHD